MDIRAEFIEWMRMQIWPPFDQPTGEQIDLMFLAYKAATEAARPDATTFGNGDWVVEVGRFGGEHAVFVAPANPPGVPGELAPPTTGEDKNRLIEGEWVMVFPTEHQAFLVADAITGRQLRRLDGTRPEPPAPVVPEKLTVSQCSTSQYCKGWNDCRDVMIGGHHE